MTESKRIILAVTGATGMLYVTALLELMQQQEIIVHGLISDAGRTVLKLEQGLDAADLAGVEQWFDIRDFTAPMASGSHSYDAMIVLPCTVGTLGSVANGFSGNLIHRAADVSLKERRPLLLAVRETPLNRTHLTNMLKAHDAGAVVIPPMPSFYMKPDNLHAMALNFAGRLCDQVDIAVPGIARWQKTDF